MNMKTPITLYIVRGLPGSGKSTLANSLTGRISHNTQMPLKAYEADQYFTTLAGDYNFDPAKLPSAHTWCLEQVRASITAHKSCVVANTFSCSWEMAPYLALAEEDYQWAARRKGLYPSVVRVVVVDLFDGGLTDIELSNRNNHGVPVETITSMRSRWEHDWRNGNPIPPWER
jgi:GTPase SAR1 family protein